MAIITYDDDSLMMDRITEGIRYTLWDVCRDYWRETGKALDVRKKRYKKEGLIGETSGMNLEVIEPVKKTLFQSKYKIFLKVEANLFYHWPGVDFDEDKYHWANISGEKRIVGTYANIYEPSLEDIAKSHLQDFAANEGIIVEINRKGY